LIPASVFLGSDKFDCFGFGPEETGVFSSVENVQTGLFLTGCATEHRYDRCRLPGGKAEQTILLEGSPGRDKTELAYSVAKATNVEVERLQCFEGSTKRRPLGEFDEL
jgi:hypothetical protein